MGRRATDLPRPRIRETPLTRWYEAGIKALDAERLKNRDEARYYREELERLRYERMERETWSRARRTYDLADEVTADSARELIETLSDWSTESQEQITLRLMCPGGDVVYGLAIYDFVVGLRAEGTPVDTLVIGWAASMASVLLQCGRLRRVAPNASILIHESRTTHSEAWTERITDTEDRLRWEQSLEDRCDAILVERSRLTIAELRERYERKDWWLTAQEAVDFGFADAIWKPKRRRA